ncbi:hypothetical protein WI73_04120 [Burkholderia ubonensis]|uniref:hypothetical protein n=1 Tax=Burkholderia ubonensis TaxID=101571 RepID=UPI0007537D86|nr:hypothetical protein [Burkholderia ubonensis]AOI73651.1 hypothetical protein WI31_29835 [Burkholderia ubonensis]KUZ22314.1 hypothetical protein WI29_02015 [Burkholderia ubonensis]KUZ28200.1 hypothetical protein WI30_22915 [Burkholderia ubonensis]KUZ39601.1 hypothetical protein WI32_07905 [Burkholderia ubonensis]KUZ49236.1 hypothetical protein WI33_19555 [Burkholderia ubonensis]
MTTTNIEYCNGFLDAMATLNCEVTDIYADYVLEALPPALDLNSSLRQHFEDYGKYKVKPAKIFTADNWHIKVEDFFEPSDQSMYKICEKWFFASSTLAQAPQERHYRRNVAIGFIDALESALGKFSARRVEITPPIWYAMEWENIAIESGNERYLLHFSRSD